MFVSMDFILEKYAQYRLKFNTDIGRQGENILIKMLTSGLWLEVEKTGDFLSTLCRNQAREKGSKEKWIRKEVMILIEVLMCLRHYYMFSVWLSFSNHHKIGSIIYIKDEETFEKVLWPKAKSSCRWQSKEPDLALWGFSSYHTWEPSLSLACS